MKVITIFNEKGGSGKSTLTCLLASWLAYAMGERVTVLDFDFPSYQMSSLRAKDLKLKAAPDSQLSRLAKGEPFSIKQIPEGTPPESVLPYVKSLKEMEEGYLLLDFPGSFRSEDHSRALLTSGIVDLLVIPIDSDRQSKEAGANIVMTLKLEAARSKTAPTKTVMLWNRETGQERRTMDRYDRYSVTETQMSALGVTFLRQRMRDIQIARRDADTFGFIRSTLCWPEDNIRIRCPYLPSLLGQVKEILDGPTEDYL